jgi:hypothetical protein
MATIERDERGWWVRLVCPDGVERRVGPFDSKGRAWWFAAQHGGGRWVYHTTRSNSTR